MATVTSQVRTEYHKPRTPPLEISSYRYKNKVIVRILLASEPSAEVVASKIKRAVNNAVEQIFREATGQ